MIDPSGRPLPALASCPLLGLPGDPQTHYSFAHDGHRCHASLRPAPIEATHQSSFCLSSSFGACPVYRGWQARGATPAGHPVPADREARPASSGRVLEGARSTVTAGAWATGPSTRRRRRSVLPLAALVAVAVVALVALVAGQLLAGPPERVAGPAATLRPSPSASAVPSASPVATATATSRPTSGAQPSTTPSGPARRVHIVQPGDRLSSIAVQYGTTIARLLELNDIPDANVIEVGQEIVLPPAGEP